jgi:hypothetical protein
MKLAFLLSSVAILYPSLAFAAPERWMDKQDLFTVGDNVDYSLYHIPGIVVTAKGTRARVVRGAEACRRCQRLG